jgi:excisionase family DNA binding protein
MAVSEKAGAEEFLTPAQAAAILHVSPQTISRWAKEGRIGAIVTLGGHRRFRAEEIRAIAGASSKSD